MSVIVRKSGMKNLQVYVKGAPEIMPDICQQSTCILANGKTISNFG